LVSLLKKYRQKDLAAKLEQIGLPFAPIAKPWDLLDDPHLNAAGGMMEVGVNGKTIHVPALPLELDGKRLEKRSDPPGVGEHGRDILAGLGYTEAQIAGLAADGIVSLPPRQA
jgi:crotonobetainyl-CoA:carnitine CoA-transferase CaiB-like acyl-CoA transferase